MTDSQNRKKRSLLINPRFQWTLIGYAAFVAVLILMAVYGLFSLGFHEFKEIGVKADFSPDHVYFQFLSLQEATFLRVLGGIAVLVAAILILGGLIISHKIAGPIYRMQKEMNSMESGKPPALKKITFRKGDYFPELAQSFNQLVDKLKS